MTTLNTKSEVTTLDITIPADIVEMLRQGMVLIAETEFALAKSHLKEDEYKLIQGAILDGFDSLGRDIVKIAMVKLTNQILKENGRPELSEEILNDPSRMQEMHDAAVAKVSGKLN